MKNKSATVVNTIIRRVKKWSLPVTGFLALLWFLIRVIPKPSRASYPCQRIAFPFASAFVLWLVGTTASALVFKKARHLISGSRKLLGAWLIAIAVSLFIVAQLSVPSKAVYGSNTYADEVPFVPSDGPNAPMGEGIGVYPGRVVWNWNVEATSWDGSSDYFWSPSYTDKTVICSMMSETIRELTNEDTDADAWNALFRYHNNRTGKGDVGYSAGEKIAVKLNLNAITTESGDKNDTKPTPQMVYAMVQQLVDQAGVAPENITLFDAGRIVPNSIYDMIEADYPGVIYKGKFTATDRTEVEVDYSDDAVIHWSSDLKIDGEREEGYTGEPSYFIKSITEAEYMINFAVLRAHHTAGVTLGGKNHFGSFRCHRSDGSLPGEVPKAAGLHQMLAVHDVINSSSSWSFEGRPMNVYNPITNIMGHKHTGGKTILYLVDGLYATAHEVGEPVKFQMAPFNNDWSSSIFASQDPVAIESVCLDFLRTEKPENKGDMFVTGSVDNYLHEAALANDPPSGTVYDPEGDGTPLSSLGVHEHWNDPVKMQYSRNLGLDTGIELVPIGYMRPLALEDPVVDENLKVWPNPVRNGKFNLFIDNSAEIQYVIIHSMSGQEVYRKEVKGVGTVSFEGITLEPGIYLMTVKTNSDSFAQKLIFR